MTPVLHKGGVCFSLSEPTHFCGRKNFINLQIGRCYPENITASCVLFQRGKGPREERQKNQDERNGKMAEDRFFTTKVCDRCGRPLDGGRTMSMFNEQTICMDCADKERERPDYKAACDAEIAAVRAGDRNFKGIGL